MITALYKKIFNKNSLYVADDNNGSSEGKIEHTQDIAREKGREDRVRNIISSKSRAKGHLKSLYISIIYVITRNSFISKMHSYANQSVIDKLDLPKASHPVPVKNENSLNNTILDAHKISLHEPHSVKNNISNTHNIASKIIESKKNSPPPNISRLTK